MTTTSNRLLMLNVGSPSQMISITTDGDDPQIIVPDLGVGPDGIAIHREHGHVFVSNMGVVREGEDFPAMDGYVERFDLAGRGRTLIVPPGLARTPKQIQCDVVGGHIYWCDREGLRVWRAGLDGSDPKVLVEMGGEDDRHDRTRHCVGIAVDAANGYLYFGLKGRPNGNEGRIMRAELELPIGSSSEARYDLDALVDGLPEPIDLELDPAGAWLYWTDRGDGPGGNTLNRAEVGQGRAFRKEVLLSGLHEAIGLAVDHEAGVAYVSDLSGDVVRMDLARPGVGTRIFSGRGPLTGIALVRS